jgi:hypothetical protein
VSFASTTCRSRALAARSAATASGADGTSGTSHYRPQPALRSQHNTLGRLSEDLHRPAAPPIQLPRIESRFSIVACTPLLYSSKWSTRKFKRSILRQSGMMINAVTVPSTAVSIRWLTWAIVAAGASRVRWWYQAERAWWRVSEQSLGSPERSAGSFRGRRAGAAAPCGAPHTCRCA